MKQKMEVNVLFRFVWGTVALRWNACILFGVHESSKSGAGLQKPHITQVEGSCCKSQSWSWTKGDA